MRSIKRWTLRLLAAVAVVSCGFIGSAAALWNAPTLLFPYHVQEGRFDLWSDMPFDAAAGHALLLDVQHRIAQSSLDDHAHHGAIIANRPYDARLTFLWASGAAGVNWYPFTRNVFIHAGDIAKDRVTGRSGRVAQPPRTLAYYIAHEIGHTLTAEHTGLIAYRGVPRWLREGVADYVGFGGEIDIDELRRALQDRDPKMDPVHSGNYARYRLLVASLLRREGWTMDRLLTSQLSQAAAERIVLAPSNP